MKLRVSSVGKIAVGAFKLTGQEIETQAMTDLTSYRVAFQQRYGSQPPVPLDVDSLVKELWEVDVVYEDIPQQPDEEGNYSPRVRRSCASCLGRGLCQGVADGGESAAAVAAAGFDN